MSISTVTSEALQLKLRQLLPSQQGFGTDLSASDTIIPIIDLTEAAEGSDVRETLQTAIAFDGSTSKAIDGLSLPATNDINSVTSYNLLFFVETGGSASLVLPAGISFLGSIRQVATSDGTLVNPSGFTPQ